jgi:hypothetical protein
MVTASSPEAHHRQRSPMGDRVLPVARGEQKDVLLQPRDAAAQSRAEAHARISQIRTANIFQQRLEVAQAIEEQNWKRFVFLHHPRMWLPLFEKHASQMTDDVYWSLLSLIYCTLDTTAHAHGHFARLFSAARPGRRAAMSPAARELFEALPSDVRIYRGYAGPRGRGLSWTLSRDTANFFAIRAWERSCDEGTPLRPVVVRGMVSKSDISTVITAFDENEVVVEPKRVRAKRWRVIQSPQPTHSFY